MAENSTLGATANGESARETLREAGRETAEQFRDRLRSKASSMGDKLREGADNARGWARSRLDNLQGSVEANPYRASAWALGLGLVAGVVLMGLMRGRR